ncbi:SDR family oxidoreductase [Pontibacter liquoris]|uniref:SDR family oxidoreductase n=1 Tax=Pontibacter liquoris TaxID=2905677 RepID=UPI001FA7B42B
MKKLADSAVQQFVRVDVILNNAGLMPLSLIDRMNVEEWYTMIDVNIKGVLKGIAAVVPYIKEQKLGQIINTSSVAGHKIFNDSAVYSATKFAVRTLTEGLRMEVKPYNIRTTIICPGAVKTELLEHITEADIQ